MMRFGRWVFVFITLFASTAFGARDAHALSPIDSGCTSGGGGGGGADGLSPPDVFRPLDDFGVDVGSGYFNPSLPAISIGGDSGGLRYQRSYDGLPDANGNHWRDNFVGTLSWKNVACGTLPYNKVWTAVVEGRSYNFFAYSAGPLVGQFFPMSGGGETLTGPVSHIYTLTLADGAVATYDDRLAGSGPQFANGARVTSVAHPNGETQTYYYNGGRALRSVISNLGYQLFLEYSADTATLPIRATVLNNAFQSCDPGVNSCAGLTTGRWPSLWFSGISNGISVTDTLGRTTTFVFNTSGQVTSIRRPSYPTSAAIDVTYYTTGDPQNFYHVNTITNGATTWTYTYVHDLEPITLTPRIYTTRTNNLGEATTVLSMSPTSIDFDPGIVVPQVRSVTDPLNRVMTYGYDEFGKIGRVTYPEGNYVLITYGDRGNIVEWRTVSKTPGTPADIVETAIYPGSCSNTKTCNHPSSTTDARGYRTDYTYDPNNGFAATVTQPAPTGAAPIGSGTQPQTRNTYTQVYAWYKNSSGTITQASTPVWRQTLVSQCQNSALCSGVPDEVKTTTTYQTGSSSVASNALPLIVTTASGDNSVSASTTTTYTEAGDVASVDGPRTDVTDVTNYRYDAMREKVGEISADPDGAGGSVQRPTVQTVYNMDGQVAQVAQGTVNGATDSDWFAFVPLQSTSALYDAQGRKARDTFSIGGATQSITQYSYDAIGRPQCTATRMNPAEFGSLPGSACALGSGFSDVRDRVTRLTYDAAGQVTQEERGVGTGQAQNYARYTYSNNGKRLSVRDANDNRSAYVYDGFDRLCRLYFPVSTISANQANTGGIAEGSLTCSSGGTNPDYEGYGYDAAGNRITLRLRSTETIGYHYDNLNRECFKDMPASVTDPTTCGASVSGAGTDDVFSDYDLLGRKLSARFASVSGSGIVYTYDALGRILTEKETWNNRTLSYIWDPAPIRRRVTYPDGNYIRTTYDALNRADQVQENGASSGAGLLADYTYDDLGRPTSVAYGNTTATSLSYAPASQDWSFTQDLNSTAQDVTVAFTKSAGRQTLTRGISNASYNYAAPTRSESYTRNGLNQYTNVAGATFTNDARGNLTSDGTRTFTYDLENRLLSVTGGSASIALTYDPLGRLRTQLVGGTTTTTFLYAGDQLVAEYNGSTLLRRYAWGPGVDRPVVWYEGAALSATTRNWLHTDEQGSVIATTDKDGIGTLYSYSSYGEPDSTRAWNTGNSRFRYTGQIALFEAQLYHYKARVYDPRLGRFLQTDPIGYKDDYNLYTYAVDDPVNRRDPSGTYTCGKDHRECPDAVVQSVNDIALAARNTRDASQRASLNELVAALGQNGDRGVNILLGKDLATGTLGDSTVKPNGDINIVVVRSLTPNDASAARQQRVDLASVVAHETRHGLDARANNNTNPATREQVRQTERNAYRDQLTALHGLSGVGPSFISRPRPSSEEADSQWVNENADRSVQQWCAAGGAC